MKALSYGAPLILLNFAQVSKEKTNGCISFQAANIKTHRDPLIPTTSPENPLEILSADHWDQHHVENIF